MSSWDLYWSSIILRGGILCCRESSIAGSTSNAPVYVLGSSTVCTWMFLCFMEIFSGSLQVGRRPSNCKERLLSWTSCHG